MQANSTYSQKKITLDLENVTLARVIDEIEASTDFKFIFNIETVSTDRVISLRIRNAEINKVLNLVFRQSPNIEYEIYRDKILLLPINEDERMSVEAKVLIALKVDVKGTVTDKNGTPLPGANIVEKGTNNGVTADFDGNFNIKLTDEKAVLVVSYIGFASKEIPLKGQTELRITLEERLAGLDEVVVIGYGTQRKSDLTGSVSSVSEEELKALPVASFDQALQGRAAGVQISQSSSQPGGALSIRIRGGNSINAGNEPLYVIDGIPIYNDNVKSQAGVIAAPSLNALSSLNPGDIESIEILKDASATAIYGSRGANGVVIVTTKRGKTGKPKITLETYTGIQEVRRTIPMLNAHQYAEFRNEAFVNGGGLPTFSDAEVQAMGEGTNWQNELFQSALIQNYQVGASGGTETSQYALSVGYFDQEGIIINSGFKRYSARLNLDSKVSDFLKVGSNLAYSRTVADVAKTGGGINGLQNIQSPNGSVVASAIFYNPVIPVRDEDGNFTFDNTSTQGNGGGNQANVPFENPIAYATLATNESFSNRLLGSVFAEFQLLKTVSFKSSFSVDVFDNKQNRYEPSTIREGLIAPNGFAHVGSTSTVSWLSENIFSYDFTFGEDHRLNGVAGFTYQDFHNESFSSSAADFVNDVVSFNDLSSGNIQYPSQSNLFDWALESYLGRLNYSFKDRYLFTFTGRIDGSSRFGKNNKYAFFPSGSFAWRLSQEEYLSSSKVISNLKLRASVGITGNQEIPVYQSLARLGVNRYTINGEPVVGISPTGVANPGLRWEKTTQTNIGMDASFFRSRLNLSVDAYQKTTDDLLLAVQLPKSSGFGTALQNIGSVENKGLELALDAILIDGPLFWSLGFNTAINKNEVTDLGGEERRYIDPGFNLFKGQAVSALVEGEPIGNFIGYQNAGIFSTQQEIDASAQPDAQLGARRYVDQNDDGQIDDKDRTIIGNALPDFTGGLNTKVSYKNFDLDVFFNYSIGNDVYNMVALEAEFLNGRQNNSTTVLNRWTPENTNTDVMSAGNPSVAYFRQSHDRWVEDASFLRLRNISLGYNFPVDKMNIEWLRAVKIYISGQNLWTLTDYTGFDPEVNLTQESNINIGFDYGAYPAARTITLGLNVEF